MNAPNRAVHEDFDLWYREAAPRLMNAIALQAGDLELAQDVVSDACVRALEKWPKVCSMQNPTGWTYRVAINILNRRRRRAGIERRLLRRMASGTPVQETEIDQELWTAISRLPARQREAIVLRYVLDLTQHDVASAMSVADGTAAATLKAARQNLFNELVGDAASRGT